MKTTYLVTLLLFCLSLSSDQTSATDSEEIQKCLKSWSSTPFTKSSPFRVITAKVKVMGIGGDIQDNSPTEKPELILVRPAVTVMAKTVMNLANPNGWYCLKGKVAVLGKLEVNLHCKAHMAASEGGATVLGASEADSGTTVLGATRVNRTGDCKK